MSLNEHTQFFGAPNEPAAKTPPVSPPNMPPVAATPPAPVPPPPAAKPKPKRDPAKIAGALAIGAVAVGSVGFISWTMFREEEAPTVAPTTPAPAPSTPIIPEAPKEEWTEVPAPAPVEETPPPPPPPPATVHRPVAAAPKPAPEPVPVAMPVLPEEIKIAEVSNDTEFKEAFLEAREQIGPGGLFEYKGQWYSTYSIEEWNRMPEDMKAEFTNRIEPIVNPAEPEESAAALPDEPLVVRLDTDNDGVEDTIMSDENHDGLADIVIKDEPGEGISSIMYVDKDKDGKLETAIPVSDEGQVLEERAEILAEPLEMPMQTAGSVAGTGELSEVVDLDVDSGLETAVPLGQEENMLTAHMAQGEVLSIENDLHGLMQEPDILPDTNTDDLFTA
ncbi:MAG: hypothetical protein U0X91_04180 [Spirosomataceae bacterium]